MSLLRRNLPDLVLLGRNLFCARIDYVNTTEFYAHFTSENHLKKSPDDAGFPGTTLSGDWRTDRSFSSTDQTMKLMNTTIADDLVPLATAAGRFGYQDAQHFREVVAPRHGIHPVKLATRWFVSRNELDQVICLAVPTPSKYATQ